MKPSTAPSTHMPGTDFEQCVSQRVPALLKGEARRFPRLMRWSPAHFVEQYPDVECKYTDDGRPIFTSSWSTFGDFFGSAMHRDYYALKRFVHDPQAPRFIEAFDFPNPYLEADQIDRFIVFGGRAGSGVLPHVHGDAVNFLVSGRKRWVLFDATPGTPGHAFWHRGWTDFGPGCDFEDWHAAEFDRLAREVKVYAFDQGPGDVVYVPAGYCHALLNVEANIGVVIERPRVDDYAPWWPTGSD